MSQSNTPPRSRDSRALDLARLRAFVAEYKRHNDAFESSMNERHARWASLGLFQPVPGAKP